jgi:hypothetical protein
MTAITPARGSFSWFELATTDQEAARQFYQALFDWTSADTPMGPGEVYTIFRQGGRDVGAVYTMRAEQRAQGIPPNWLVYVAVDDADAAAGRATKLGGTVIVPPLDVMDAGRMAVIQDPTAAVFAMWQAKKSTGVGVFGEINTVSWVDLQTRDQAAAAEFYTSLFGWQMVEGKSMNPAKPGDYYHIVNGADFIGGVPPPTAVDPNAPPHWLIYVEVADCRATTAKATSLGARAYVDTMEIGKEGRISVIADPQGAVFALHERVKAS